MDIPGDVGFHVIGDKAMEFYLDMPNFVKKNVKANKSRVFNQRFLLKPTVFLASNSAVHDILTSNNAKIRLGYKDYFQPLFGDILLFSDGANTMVWRKAFHSVLGDSRLYRDEITSLIKLWIDNLSSRENENIYNFLKQMTLQISLSLFLGFLPDGSSHEICDIQKLITKHWHGLISVPLNLRIPLLLSSSYRKAIEAKEKLLNLINSRLDDAGILKSNQLLKKLQNDDTLNNKDVANHILLFISALAPKAYASILLSFILSRSLWQQEFLDENGNMSDENLDCVLHEIYRFWPPFIGGRRVVTEDTKVGGYKLREGYGIVYISWAAHRDPDVFPEPDSFKPVRWKTFNKNDRDKIFTFGAGKRSCLGLAIIDVVVKEVCKCLLKTYTWKINEDVTLSMLDLSSWKWLPVARLKEIPSISFTPKLD